MCAHDSAADSARPCRVGSARLGRLAECKPDGRSASSAELRPASRIQWGRSRTVRGRARQRHLAARCRARFDCAPTDGAGGADSRQRSRLVTAVGWRRQQRRRRRLRCESDQWLQRRRRRRRRRTRRAWRTSGQRERQKVGAGARCCCCHESPSCRGAAPASQPGRQAGSRSSPSYLARGSPFGRRRHADSAPSAAGAVVYAYAARRTRRRGRRSAASAHARQSSSWLVRNARPLFLFAGAADRAARPAIEPDSQSVSR